MSFKPGDRVRSKTYNREYDVVSTPHPDITVVTTPDIPSLFTLAATDALELVLAAPAQQQLSFIGTSPGMAAPYTPSRRIYLPLELSDEDAKELFGSSSKAIHGFSDTCTHKWRNYVGVLDRYEYCEHCDIKRGDKYEL